ncbi:MAG TPA: hypothetical protein VIQ05_03885 [Tardiphaga sp.]
MVPAKLCQERRHDLACRRFIIDVPYKRETERSRVVTAISLFLPALGQLICVKQGAFLQAAACPRLRPHGEPARWRPDSLDESAAIPTESSCLAVDAGYLDQGCILIAKQSNIASVHGKHPPVLSFGRDIDFVQTSRGAAVDGLVGASKVIEMKGHEFAAWNGEIERKLRRGSKRSTTGYLPPLDDGAESPRQVLEMSGIPTILGYPAVRKCWPEHSRQAEKRDCNRRSESPCIHDFSPDIEWMIFESSHPSWGR